jgi:hypothetical protein
VLLTLLVPMQPGAARRACRAAHLQPAVDLRLHDHVVARRHRQLALSLSGKAEQHAPLLHRLLSLLSLLQHVAQRAAAGQCNCRHSSC